jgi:hypothetical protein
MILNLKELNEYIEPHRFKMETFESALKLIKSFSYFASIDLRHAYYSINMAENDQKFLRNDEAQYIHLILLNLRSFYIHFDLF